ncbi:hypothetical protein OROHE_026287 [Orobanche hederae]
MDRSWLNADRRSTEYISGVEEFIAFALTNSRDPRNICCPCTRCGNDGSFSARVVRDHLFVNGIDTSYTVWTDHGEAAVVVEDNESNNGSDAEFDESVDGPLGVEADSDLDLDFEGDNKLSDDCNEFQKFVGDANKPLYPGCKSHNKLNALVQLYNLKAKHGMSDVAFGEWLQVLGDFLLEGNEIPASCYDAKKTLGALGMGYKKIHACPNDCILYRLDDADADECPTCHASRWKLGRNSNPRVGVPAKVLWYFPPIPRFVKMFRSGETSKNLTWHATGRNKDGLMRHPADAATWKFVDEKWPEFGADPRNLRLALSSDGFNPHSSLSSKYSCWPVILVIYNLPPWLIMKRKHMMLTLLISGPTQPGNNIDVYLQPLIDDLKLLWEGVSGVYDACKNQTFTLRGSLLCTVSDFPAFGNLSGRIVKGYNACPLCLENTKPKRLVNGVKMAYIGHRRFLARNHPHRRQKASFNNRTEHSAATVPLTGEQVLNRQKLEVPEFKFGKKTAPPPYKGAEDETRPCWKKVSIFFQLEYWQFLSIRHCLDVMHIEKNIVDSIIGTLLNIPGKTKDGVNTRLDLVEMGIRSDLHPNLKGSKKERLTLARWNLKVAEKRCMCGSFFGMKVSEDYYSNISSLVSMSTLSLSGLKSHDCHALMQQLLPIAIRGVLEKPVRVAVIRLCLFFNEICSKTIDVSRLPKIQSDLIETFCELEKYFPTSFFDIMVHLTVHLVRQVELCGPFCFTWMYPFERYMKVCKGYVRNRTRPEGCIAECYIAEEAVEFLAELFCDERTVGMPSAPITLDRRTSGATVVSVYGKLYDQAHLCVLQNTDEFRDYFNEHWELLKLEFPRYVKDEKWLTDKQNKTFADWVKARVATQLSEPGHKIPEIVRWLSDKPSNEVPKFAGYKIRGTQYTTKERDDMRSTQNSGVYLVAETPQVASARDKRMVREDMSFYGVIIEIWELNYEKFRFPIFKCDWVDNGK